MNMTDHAPRSIWAGSLSFIDGMAHGNWQDTDLNARACGYVEYVRADLVPTWRTTPHCVGTWYYLVPDTICVTIHAWWISEDCLKNPADLLPTGGLWLGPIPEDK